MGNIVVRLSSLTLKNIKNVKNGIIIMPLANERKFECSRAEILGIYGQNGSGKTAIVDALYFLQGIITGEELDQRIIDYIDTDSANAEINAEFKIFGDNVLYEVGYHIIFSKIDDGVIIEREYLNCAINKDGNRTNKNVFMDYQRTQTDVVFKPLKRVEELVGKDKNVKMDLIVARKIAEKSNCSYIFGKDSREIFFKKNSEFKNYSIVIHALFDFALKDLFVIRSSHSGLISANFLLPMAFRIEKEKTGMKGDFAVPLMEPVILDIKKKDIRDIYSEYNGIQEADQNTAEQMMNRMKEIIKQNGNPVIGSDHYSVMDNYQKMEQFLKSAEQEEKGSVILYEADTDGGITRKEYSYDGKEMSVMSAKMIWSEDTEPVLTYISLSKIKEWAYTENGNFCYELCVPEPPEVTEIVDGSCIIRVKPLSEECREYSKKYVSTFGYQGNNLLCSNWNAEDMQGLDYNGLYEYFYQMKYGEKFTAEKEVVGIPAEEFENVIMTYLPVTKEELKEWAVYDEQSNMFIWERLGCGNYSPTHFGLSLPEVTEVRHNEDGTIVLTIHAVCDSVVCNDVVITHELTMKIQDDGTIQYVGNRILDNGIDNIPRYQYRLGNLQN